MFDEVEVHQGVQEEEEQEEEEEEEEEEGPPLNPINNHTLFLSYPF